jgi:hypothetical protein
MITGIHRWQVESTRLSQFRLQGQKAYPGGPSKVRRDPDILYVVVSLHFAKIVKLTGRTDSSLESIHRKQEKGWTRGNGTVKEDSKFRDNIAHGSVLTCTKASFIPFTTTDSSLTKRTVSRYVILSSLQFSTH